MLKGTIIENSLSDKSILKEIRVTKTWKSGNWILHSVIINDNQVLKLSKSLNTGPWYIHLWEQGKDDMLVVFRDKIFNIKYSDRNTWREAVNHGKSIGISEKQLDFPID